MTQYNNSSILQFFLHTHPNIFRCLVVLIVINSVVVVTRRWPATRRAGLQQMGDEATEMEIEMEQMAVY
jgi:hypothetical protein